MSLHAPLFFSPTSPSSLSSSPSSLLPLRHSPSSSLPQTIIHRTRTQPQRIKASRAADSSASISEREAATVAEAEEVEARFISGSDVVRLFYEGINRHDLVSVEGLIADDCFYEDLVFPRPFVGRKAIMEFFKKFNDSISTDLQFVIDDISDEDNAAVGVTWHLEWSGRPFPFSKGCSFYRLRVINGFRQIIYARDSVEPAIKPGESVLVAVRGVAWLLRQFPQLADRL
ncbi:hypothetical protein Droror1_Dr00021615 [Drosera rotundifolia]